MQVYTGTGDTGQTGLYGGQRVDKDDIRVEAYGTVDEVNALLGVAALRIADGEIRAIVLSLQNELFEVGADLATPLEREETAGRGIVPRIQESQVMALERLIDRLDADLSPLRQFILPGGSEGAAMLHQARTVVRRAERRTVSLVRAAPDNVNITVLRYLNRLADLLFVMARTENHRAGVDDIPWSRPRASQEGSGY